MLALGGARPDLVRAGPSPATDFGRWQSTASRCQWQRGPSTLWHDCQGLRLEQNREGMLSVRFLAGGQREPIALEHLVFAGALDPGQEGLRCGGDGNCSPSWPTRLAVATMAAASFDQRGLPLALPRARLARGHCQLERTLVRCQARGSDGHRWTAEARF